MGDVFSIVEAVLSKATDLKFLEGVLYIISQKIQIFIIGLVVLFGIIFIVWIVRGVRE